MRVANGNLQTLLIVFCMIFLISFNHCEANDKKDKHKHKPPAKQEHKNDQHHRKNTTSHHSNHTDGHNATAAGSAPSDIGWSLHNDQNQHAPSGNPHGYALQHHEAGHSAQSPPGSHPQAPQHVPPHPQSPQHAPDQPPHSQNPQHAPGQPLQPHPDHHAPQTQVTQPQSSGPSALGAGLGGLALGAIGGAAGGYFLSEALNSGDKDEKHSEADTTLLTETTLTTLAAAASPTVISETVASEAISVPSIEVTQVTVATDVVSLASEQPPAVEAKAEQKLADTPVTTAANGTDTSNGFINKLSLNVLVMSVVSSFLLLQV